MSKFSKLCDRNIHSDKFVFNDQLKTEIENKNKVRQVLIVKAARLIAKTGDKELQVLFAKKYKRCYLEYLVNNDIVSAKIETATPPTVFGIIIGGGVKWPPKMGRKAGRLVA
jgi:hypothetical protein